MAVPNVVVTVIAVLVHMGRTMILTGAKCAVHMHTAIRAQCTDITLILIIVKYVVLRQMIT